MRPMHKERILFRDSRDYRLLDLKPDGISCIAGVGMSNLDSVQKDYELHCHPNAIEICLCLKGAVTFETETSDYKFLPGHICVSAPDQPHRLKNNPKGFKHYRLLFSIPKSGGTFLGLDARESEWLTRSLMHPPKRTFQSIPRVREGFEKIFDLYDNARHSPARHTRMKAAVLELLIAIVDASHRLPYKSPDSILSIARRIRESPEKDYPVTELAKEAGLSRSAFSALFKNSLGLPLHAYVISRRMLAAKRLIETTSKPIADIAAELNFATIPHFITSFRHTIGTTPHELRKGHKKNRPR